MQIFSFHESRLFNGLSSARLRNATPNVVMPAQAGIQGPQGAGRLGKTPAPRLGILVRAKALDPRVPGCVKTQAWVCLRFSPFPQRGDIARLSLHAGQALRALIR